MSEFLALPLILCSVSFGLMDCTSSYDQRQTGDFNVQIGLKNIQLIALLKGGKEEYVDYDYAYDYSEMTIKPQNGTTPKPLTEANAQLQNNGTTLLPVLVGNATTQDISQESINSSTVQNLSNQIANVTELNFVGTGVNSSGTVASSNSEALHNNGTQFNDNTTKMSVTMPNKEIKVTANMLSVTSTAIPEIAAEHTTVLQDSPNNMSVTQTTHCRRGFVQNHQGKCEYKGHGTTNALRRIVKLAQKIKIGRGYTET